MLSRGASNVVMSDTFSKTGDHLTKHQSHLRHNLTPVHMSLFDSWEKKSYVCVLFLLVRELDNSALWQEIWSFQILPNQYLLKEACDKMTEKNSWSARVSILN